MTESKLMDQTPSDIVLDIGGEGRHADAWNVNRCKTKTLGRHAGQSIPRLIIARADALPFPDNCLKSLIVERTPLTRAAVRELSRVIHPDGQIVLRHVPFADRDRHAPAMSILGGNAQQRTTKIYGQLVLETVIHFSEILSPPQVPTTEAST
jgi:ubiquinone/menaquinone biosynthesis C-methylase UbiE